MVTMSMYIVTMSYTGRIMTLFYKLKMSVNLGNFCVMGLRFIMFHICLIIVCTCTYLYNMAIRSILLYTCNYIYCT